MNAPLRPLRLLPFDNELERQILGLAMAGEPLAPWLEERHFAAGWNPTVFRTIRDLEPDCGLARVAEWVTAERSGLSLELLTGRRTTSADLLNMMLEGAFARRMGWAVEVEWLRELADQRDLLRAIREVEARLLAGDWTMRDARKRLNLERI